MATRSDFRLPEPVVKFGTKEQKDRMLPPLISGKERACFGVTEPNIGLDTLKLQTRAVRKGDRYEITGSKVCNIFCSGKDASDNFSSLRCGFLQPNGLTKFSSLPGLVTYFSLVLEFSLSTDAAVA
jgi:hypothetical protein